MTWTQLTPQQWGAQAAKMVVAALRSQPSEYAHSALLAMQHAIGVRADELADSLTVDRAEQWVARCVSDADLVDMGYQTVVTEDGQAVSLRRDTTPAPAPSGADEAARDDLQARVRDWAIRCRKGLLNAGTKGLAACSRAHTHADVEHVRDLQLYLDGAADFASAAHAERLRFLSLESLDLQFELERSQQ